MAEAQKVGEKDTADILDYLATVAESSDGPVVADFDELAKVDEDELAGQWFDFPAVPGCQVQIAHLRAAFDRKAELERQYRSKKGLRADEAVPAEVERRIWNESLFGTVVLGWKGVTEKGNAVPFTPKNLRDKLEIFHFRKFVMEKASTLQAKREAAEESTGKG